MRSVFRLPVVSKHDDQVVNLEFAGKNDTLSGLDYKGMDQMNMIDAPASQLGLVTLSSSPIRGKQVKPCSLTLDIITFLGVFWAPMLKDEVIHLCNGVLADHKQALEKKTAGSKVRAESSRTFGTRNDVFVKDGHSFSYAVRLTASTFSYMARTKNSGLAPTMDDLQVSVRVFLWSSEKANPNEIPTSLEELQAKELIHTTNGYYANFQTFMSLLTSEELQTFCSEALVKTREMAPVATRNALLASNSVVKFSQEEIEATDPLEVGRIRNTALAAEYDI